MSIARAVSLALALGVAAACASTRHSATTDTGTRSLSYGYHSGLTQPTQLVLRDETSWADLWKRHHSIVIPTPLLPAVDFDKEMVVVVALGERPTGGYGVRVRAVRHDGKKLVVEAVESKPDPGALVPMAVTTPYDFSIAKRFDGEVVFDVR